MNQWYIKHGKYWMIQWGWPVFCSIGIHLDFKAKYIDLHLVFAVLTLGKHDSYDDYQAWWCSRWQQ